MFRLCFTLSRIPLVVNKWASFAIRGIPEVLGHLLFIDFKLVVPKLFNTFQCTYRWDDVEEGCSWDINCNIICRIISITQLRKSLFPTNCMWQREFMLFFFAVVFR